MMNNVTLFTIPRWFANRCLSSRFPGLALALAVLAGGCATYHPLPLTQNAVDRALTVPPEATLKMRAARLRNPSLPPVALDLRNGLSPDEAAVLAVLVNPSLRSERDRLALSSAQLLQAGILPNPQLDFSLDPVTGGNTQGTSTGYGFGVSWDLSALVTRGARVAAARTQAASVRLDVAWSEWQVALAAKKATYDLAALRGQLAKARAVDRLLAGQLALVQRAVDAHDKTLLDLSAAQAASQQAHAGVLSLAREVRGQELLLNEALGLPPEQAVALEGVALPSRLDLPSEKQLRSGLEDRRLDLLALKRGYESQEETVRTAILAQFPGINLGFHHASDTSDVHTTGFGVTIDLPVFDRNQGAIAIERATRQKLFDEYVGRVFQARSAIARSLADVRSITAELAAAEAAVPALERLVSAYRDAVDRGNADVLSYYIAQQDLFQKQMDILRLKGELMDNRVALEIASGEYLPAPGRSPSPPARGATEEGSP